MSERREPGARGSAAATAAAVVRSHSLKPNFCRFFCSMWLHFGFLFFCNAIYMLMTKDNQLHSREYSLSNVLQRRLMIISALKYLKDYFQQCE